MLFHELIYLTHNYDDLINYVSPKGVLRKRITCPRCTKKISGHLFIVPIANKTTSTLIRRYIALGSIICSDTWRAYDALFNEIYIHQTVNHSRNFVNPVNGVHTQNIERLWRDVCNGIPRFGTREYHNIHYLAEFIFKRKYDYSDRIDKFFEIIAYFYPLMKLLKEIVIKFIRNFSINFISIQH
ncbi:hypothetical protein ALC57_11042 [Trachymyrmex cornetzi]|uniref:ISXO2-like transposase domain-containing protein n=1 Tax=Trachymyrmex cornetzi TaxID=471704 RepID=A0A151J382_9HYME|nr:hypothetical protein ALC57_11042 [Trachymyrmex cornetzi]